MQGEILHLVRGRVFGQIGRAGTDHRVTGAEPAGHQIGVEVIGDANGGSIRSSTRLTVRSSSRMSMAVPA